MAETKIETVRLLIVSRDSAVLRPLWSMAETHSWHVENAASAWDAIERVQSGATPHLLLLDLPRGDSDGMHILRWMRRLRPDLPVIVICSSEDAGRNREATRLGAHEVFIRPFDETRLEASIQRHLAPLESEDAEIASEDIEQIGPDSFFVSASPITQKLRAQAELLAEADVPVLILGESGCGKDTVAKLIHKHSVRSGFQFLKINCADMPADLLEAELFGGDRATSTGNGHPGPGKIERGDRGIVFLDEITEMPLSLQARLMQVLHDKVLNKRGRESAVPVDVRIIAATSASIDQVLSERKLKEDLYYRLSAFTVQVPSLRQRRSEIPLLLRHTMHQLARHYGLPAREISSAVLDACKEYSWPGNLKELESFVKRYLVAGVTEFTFNEMNSGLTSNQGRRQESGTAQRIPLGANSIEPDQRESKSLKSLIQNVKSEAERNAIGTALQKTGWNRKAAARMLQVSYRTLLYKIDQYHMSSSEPFLSPLPAEKFSFQNSGTRGNGKE